MDRRRKHRGSGKHFEASETKPNTPKPLGCGEAVLRARSAAVKAYIKSWEDLRPAILLYNFEN